MALVINEAKPEVYREVVVKELVSEAEPTTYTLTLTKKQMLFLVALQGEFPCNDEVTPLAYKEWCQLQKDNKEFVENNRISLKDSYQGILALTRTISTEVSN